MFYTLESIVLININSLALISLGGCYLFYSSNYFLILITVCSIISSLNILLFSISNKSYHYDSIKKNQSISLNHVKCYKYPNVIIGIDRSIKYLIVKNKAFLITIINSKDLGNNFLYKVENNIIFIFQKSNYVLKYIISPDYKFIIIQEKKIKVKTENGLWENDKKISHESTSFIFVNSIFSFIDHNFSCFIKKNTQNVYECYL